MTLTLVPISPFSLQCLFLSKLAGITKHKGCVFGPSEELRNSPDEHFIPGDDMSVNFHVVLHHQAIERKQYKAVRKRGWVSQVFRLLTTMRSSLFLLALAAANGVIASLIPSDDYYRPTSDIASYINSLVPVAKDVMLHKIAGPALGPGVDVNSPLVLHLPHSMLMMLYLACRPYNGHARGGPPRLPHLLGP